MAAVAAMGSRAVGASALVATGRNDGSLCRSDHCQSVPHPLPGSGRAILWGAALYPDQGFRLLSVFAVDAGLLECGTSPGGEPCAGGGGGAGGRFAAGVAGLPGRQKPVQCRCGRPGHGPARPGDPLFRAPQRVGQRAPDLPGLLRLALRNHRVAKSWSLGSGMGGCDCAMRAGGARLAAQCSVGR